mgnify:CR=1 FL=1
MMKLFLQKVKMIEKRYNIYAKEKCIYQSLSEDEFNQTWKMIQNFLSIIESDFKREDLSFKEIAGNLTSHT